MSSAARWCSIPAWIWTRSRPSPLPDGPPRAVVVGALVGWKRPDLALEIVERMPELHLTFVGSGPITPRHERVTLAGQVDDVDAELAKAHVLLHCADAEPYGMALIEALAAGRPVVAPDAAGPREIVTDGAGRLYPPGDADAAVQALRAVLADPGNPRAAGRAVRRARLREALRGVPVTRFAVVVVLYRSRDDFARLLTTLPPCELVVVDAGPDDGGADAGATARRTRHRAARQPRLRGGEQRRARTHVQSPTTVLLNPDTADLADLTELARRAQTTGLHAPRILNQDGSVQRSAHPLPGTLGAFLPAVSPWVPTRAEPYRSTRPTTVGWAIAACLAARTDLIHFDERIHLWAEDMDLCLQSPPERGSNPLPPRPDDHPHRPPQRRRRAVRGAREEPPRGDRSARSGDTARRLDDAAQLLTFATRAWKGRASAPSCARSRARAAR